MFNFNSRYRSNTIPAALITLAACFCTTAAAGENVVPADFTFKFAPTDLATAGGTDRVYGQLVKNARKACRALGSGRELWRMELREACQADLIDKVVARIGRPELSARHRSSAYFDLARQSEKHVETRR